MPLTAGTRLGPYEIVAPIGAGGRGEVYKARDTRLERTVALKVLPPSLAADPEFKARFEREAKSISALNHPHIWQVSKHIIVDRPTHMPIRLRRICVLWPLRSRQATSSCTAPPNAFIAPKPGTG